MTRADAAPGVRPHALGAPEPYVRADLYDLLFSGYAADLEFWLSHARAARGPVLDLCCGTGRVLLPMLEAGVDADGVDLYPEMLERLKHNAAARSLKARVYAADMRDFTTPRRYALVMIPFNAFAHNLDADAQIATLKRCHAHLEPGGLLAFDVFTASPAMIASPGGDPVLELEVPHPGDEGVVQLYDSRRLDVVAQTQHSQIEIRELAADKRTVASHRFETVVRWVYRAEMELLLRLAGFSRAQVCGGFDLGPVTDDSSALVTLAWRD